MNESETLRDEGSFIESRSIGSRTRIGARARVFPGAVIGDDCNIGDATLIENDVRLGNRVTVGYSVALWDGIMIEDDVFIGANATFTEGPFPDCKRPQSIPRTTLKRGASVGANTTIFAGS